MRIQFTEFRGSIWILGALYQLYIGPSKTISVDFIYLYYKYSLYLQFGQKHCSWFADGWKI